METSNSACCRRATSFACALLASTLSWVAAPQGHAQTNDASPRPGPAGLVGEEASYLDLGAGAFNVWTHRDAPDNSAMGLVEFRYGKPMFFFIRPAIGLLASSRGSVFGYGGLSADFAFDRFVISPLAGVGGYHQGDGENLGGTFQFRLALGIAYELADHSRLGLLIGHISNAGIHRINPGEDELLVTYAIPLARLF